MTTRPPGRPRRPADAPKLRPRSVKLDPVIEDAICRIALRSGRSVHALLQLAAARLVADERTGTLTTRINSLTAL